jgi:hypothetical protein
LQQRSALHVALSFSREMGDLEMSVVQNMYIRNVFGGKSLLDASEDNVQYKIQPFSGGWRFNMVIQDKLKANEILKCKDQLNIFVTEKQGDKVLRKWWYYSKDGRVDYNEEDNLLTILADSKMEYTPE